MSKIKFVDLFAGIGGFHIAFKAATKKLKLESECVLASEIDNHAIDVYSKNFNFNKDEIKNIREIDKKNVKNFDILFAGFPCQAFSSAGNKLGFLDKTRGTLFFDIVDLVAAKEMNERPKFLLLENVAHLIHHDNGKTFEIIQESISKLGYITTKEHLILNSADFGVSQNRKRVYILCIRKDLANGLIDVPNEEVINFINSESSVGLNEDEIFEPYIDDKYYLDDKKVISALIAWGEFVKKVKPLPGRTIPVVWYDEMVVSKSIRKKLYEEAESEWRRKYYKDMWDFYDINRDFINEWADKYKVSGWAKREKKFEWQVGAGHNDIKQAYVQLRQSGIRCRNRERGFPTLVAMVQIPLLFDSNRGKWRYLNPKEVGNLQSFYQFDKKFKNYSELNPEETNADYFTYKQFGNSINIKVVYLLMMYLLKKWGF